MKIQVKLLGRYKEITEKEILDLSIKKDDTIRDVIDCFVSMYPEIEIDKKFILVSKNNVYTTKDEKVTDGDKITLSPPVVSGG
jgi:molybdopterin converting factor small subunit